MTLRDFVYTPCLVCGNVEFNFSYVKPHLGRDKRRLILNGNTLSAHAPSFNISIHDESIMLSDRLRESMPSIRIRKECAKENHYRTSTSAIYIPLTPNENIKLSILDDRMYDRFILKLNSNDDNRVPEEGASIDIIINHSKNKTMVRTTETGGYKNLPFIPLDRFDFKNPVQVLNKLESLMVLI